MGIWRGRKGRREGRKGVARDGKRREDAKGRKGKAEGGSEKKGEGDSTWVLLLSRGLELLVTPLRQTRDRGN